VHQKGHIGLQGARFFIVSLAAFAVNQLWLVLFIDLLHWRKVVSQAIAIVS
jgi:GtrA-like protein.